MTAPYAATNAELTTDPRESAARCMGDCLRHLVVDWLPTVCGPVKLQLSVFQ
jgi:hypothetical protein